MPRLIDFAKSDNRRKVVPLAGYPGAELTKTSLKQNLFNPKLQARSLKLLSDQINPDAIFAMMDLSVEAGALGLPVRFPVNESPTVEQHPVKSADDLRMLNMADPMDDCRINMFIQTIREMKRRFDIPIGAYVAGPFTLAGLLAGASEITMATFDDPKFVDTVVDFCENLIMRYAKSLHDAGANMICILEPTAVMLSPDLYVKHSGESTKRIIESLDCPSILHICGNTSHLVESMCETGAQGLSLDADVSMPDIIKRMPEDCVLIGNINPVSVVQQGTPEKVRQESLALLETMIDHDNFIFSTGCDLPPGTPIENIAAMKAAAEEFEASSKVCS